MNPTVEFTYADTLDSTVGFTVYKIVYGAGDEDGGIKDLIGNALTMEAIELASSGDKEFDGVDDTPDGLEYEDVDQIDGKTFEVKFPRLVKFIGGGNDKTTGIGVNFTASYKSTKATVLTTGDDEIRFKIDGDNLIKEDTDYKFNLATLLEDLHATPVVNEDETAVETVFTGEYDDKDAPYIDDIVAVNRLTDRKSVV